MDGWMFFPAEKSGTRNREFDIIFEALPGMKHLSREEWHEFVPESHERKQGRSIGFCCGGSLRHPFPGPPADLPPFPMMPFRSDLTIMPLCWTCKTVLTVFQAAEQKYLLIHPHAFRSVLTVTGTFADRPPHIRVCGSCCFFPPRYRMAESLKSKV